MAAGGITKRLLQGAEEAVTHGRGLRESVDSMRSANNVLGEGRTGMFGRLAQTAKWGGANIMASTGGTWGGTAKAIGGHMLRGGVVGGLAGGTMEAAQGGSFWTGAKEGAWNGAIGWGGYRTFGRAVGANGPIKGLNAGMNMYRATGTGKVSKQARALLNQKQRDGLARMAMNGNNRV